MSYGHFNRGPVVIELPDDDIEEIDLTGENNGISSINHEATNMSYTNISRSDVELRTSYGRFNRGPVVIELLDDDDDDDEVIDLNGENNEVISVSDRATIASDWNANTSDGGSVASSEDTNMHNENFDVPSVSDEATIASDVDTDTSDESSVTSYENTDMSDEDIEIVSVSDEATTTSDVDINTSDESSVTSSEDTDTSDEDIENMSVSDEADTDTDATSQDSNDDDYQPDEECSQPDEEPARRDCSASIDTGVDSWLDEWPDQSPAKIDLKNFRRFPQSLGEHLIPKRRHSQKFRDFKYGKASILQILVVWTQVHPSERHFWLPSAFDHPRGRPYELICERVWDSWRRESRDRAMRDAIPSIERGGERNWPNAGPAMIRFPEHRIRHKNRRRN